MRHTFKPKLLLRQKLTDSRDDAGSQDHEDGGDEVCPDDCGESAKGREDPGDGQEDEGGGVDGPVAVHHQLGRVDDEEGPGEEVGLERGTKAMLYLVLLWKRIAPIWRS